ncbi:MAG TPA: type II and III secretion system protein family protein [Rhizomicrobium sp.]|nr:type II and III secretion system protein family protein [Rhizomicrobium sp.]
MRNATIAFGVLAAISLALPALARTPVRHEPVAQKVLNVSTRGDGPAHQRITLALDKAALVQLDTNARDVLVSNPGIVDAVVRTPRRVFLLAMKTGQTNAFFFDSAGHQILSIDIRVERDVTDLGAMMHNNFSHSNIHVSAMNDNVVLTGTVQNAMEATRAQDLATSFAGDPKKVVNMLKVDANDQVLLKVRVAEMQRSVSKQFGIDLSAAINAWGVPIVAQTSNPFGLVGRALSDASGMQVGPNCPLFNQSSQMAPSTHLCANGVLQALEEVGLIRTLAEPNLTAVSGETARFLAGGEFPVPGGRDSQGNVSIIFKQFGVGLSFTPVVLSENRISLQISTEVSELTNTGAFTLSAGSVINPQTGAVTSIPGITVPALNVRRAQTTVELPSGGSFAIAGLLQHTTKQQIDAFPGLKDMPVLGALFRSRDFLNNETELVVLVSTYLVKPVSGKHLAAPTDGFVPPSDVDTILTGRLNVQHPPVTDGLKSAGNTKLGFIVQ